jgi:hypothetical protein
MFGSHDRQFIESFPPAHLRSRDFLSDTDVMSDGSHSTSETFGRASLSLSRLFFSIFWWSGRVERVKKPGCDPGNFVDGGLKRGLVRLRRLIEARNLAHELQRCGPDLVVRDGGIEIEKRLNIPAHESNLRPLNLLIADIFSRANPRVQP